MLYLVYLQDVVEIMKESLYDKYVDEHGVVDFARSGGMSQQKESKRFLSALNKQSELQQKDCFSISVSNFFIHWPLLHTDIMSYSVILSQEIYSLADRIGLKVPDVDTFIDNLNSIGYLIKKGPKTYQVFTLFHNVNFSNFDPRFLLYISCKQMNSL